MASINGTSGNDTLHGTNSDDTVKGGKGDDDLWGEDGNDIVSGGMGKDTIRGGKNSGVFTYVAPSITVKYVSSDAAYHNSFGYYVIDSAGKPTVGKILWADVKDVAANTSVTITGVDPSKIGYFIIPNGGNLNGSLANNTNVHFEKIGGMWKAVLDNNQVLQGQGASVFFDKSNLNSDNTAHAKSLSNGNVGFEDLVKGGDKDYNDATFKITNNAASLNLNGGDQLWGGDVGGKGDKVKDVFVFNAGDRLHTINDFEKSIDKLQINGYSAANAQYIASGNDTFVKLSATDGILLKNISVSDAPSQIQFINNNAPVAINVSSTGNEDASAIAINLSASDNDGTIASYRVVALPPSSQGVLYSNAALTTAVVAGTDFASSTLYFKPTANFNGSVDFNYIAKDNNGADSNSAQAHINVTPVNDAAVIGGNITGAVTEDGTSIATGKLTITDVDGPSEAKFNIQTLNSANGYGSLSIQADGSWTYNLINGTNGASGPVQNLSGGQKVNDVFNVSSVDGTTKGITITITGTNDAPFAAGNPNINVVEDTKSPLFTLKASDIDGTISSYTVTAINNGSLYYTLDSGTTYSVVSANQTITNTGNLKFSFQGSPDYNGSASVLYKATDNSGAPSNVATVNFTVTPDNDPPVAANDTLTFVDTASADNAINLFTNDTAEGTSKTIISVSGTPVVAGLDVKSATPILANEVARYELRPLPPYENNLVSPSNVGLIAILSIYANGVVHLEANGALQFIPDAQSIILSGISYTMQDDQGQQSTASVTFTIEGQDNHDVIIGTPLNDTLSGGVGNDVILGQDGDDTLLGGAGNDYIEGGNGNDYLDGGLGTDTVSYTNAAAAVSVNLATTVVLGGAGTDTVVNFENIEGSNFNDNLSGDSNNNIINGNAGNDTLNGGDGDDTLNGGDGTDTVSYAGASSRVTVNLSINGPQNTGGAGIDTLSNIENIFGSSFDDILIGNSGNNVLAGAGGDDILDGALGTDTASYATSVSGVTVNIVLNSAVGDGFDTLYNISNIAGSNFNDTLTGNSNDNILNGNLGADLMIGGLGSDTYVVDDALDIVTELPGEGADTVQSSITYVLADNVELGQLLGNANIDLTGNILANSLSGNSGDNIIDGGLGTDNVTYGAIGGGMILNLSTGNVTGAFTGNDTLLNIENVFGTTGADTIIGNAANNTLNGNSGNDIIEGGDGDDILTGAAGDDSLDGGNGIDTARYDLDTASVTVNLFAGTASGASIGTDTLINIENIIGSNFNDVLSGNADNNKIEGGGGIDTISYAYAPTSGVTVNLTTNIATGTDVGTDTLLTIENITGSNFNDVITGNTQANVIDGGLGADIMAGGLGDDTYVVDDIFDSASEAPGAGTDLVQIVDGYGSSGYILAINVENLTLLRTGDFQIQGNGSDNIFIGNSDYNEINGGAGLDTVSFANAASAVMVDLTIAVSQNTGNGSVLLTSIENLSGSIFNDTLIGDTNSNVLDGGAGDDTLDGGAGIDTVSYDSSASAVVVDLFNNKATGNGIDTLVGIENVLGSDFNDTINGNAANNILNGGLGQNTVSYAYAVTSGVVVNLSTGTATGLDVGTDTLLNIVNIKGSDFNDNLTGNNGNNTIDGGAGIDAMTGGLGNDTYVVDRAGDVVTEALNEGTDLVQITATYAAASYTLADNVENLTVLGTAKIDINGNILNNIIIDNNTSNIINGALGNDTVSYINATSAIVVTLALVGISNVTGGGGNDGLISIENIIGSNFNDTIVGSNGDNIINGGLGDDNLDGGAGNDTLSYANATAGVAVNLATNTVIGGGGNDTIVNFENIIGSSFNDAMVGNSGDNVFDGGAGNDRIDGEAGMDTVTYATSLGAQNVNLATGISSGSAGTDFLNNIENVIGTNFNDTITGNASNNIIDGGAGIDNMSGGLGDDTYMVDVGGDLVSELAGQGTDTVNSLATYALSSNIEILNGIGSANISLVGNSTDNVISGNSGNNALTGGTGQDKFATSIASSFGNDSITDFQIGGLLPEKLSFSGVLDVNGDNVVNLDDLLGISRVVDDGGNAKLEVYNQNIGISNDPTGATLLGSITLTGIAPSGATELNQLLTQPGQIEVA